MNSKSTLRPPRVIFQLLIFIVVIPLLPLLLASRRHWWQARKPLYARQVGDADPPRSELEPQRTANMRKICW